MRSVIQSFLVGGAALGLTACASMSLPWQDDRPDAIDDALLVDLPDEDREAIAELRAERARLGDELAAAEREIDRRAELKKIAAQELDVAKEEVEMAEAQARASAETEAVDGDEGEELSFARAHVAWSRAQIDYADAWIEHARAQRELVERRIELTDARLELRKARAVRESDDLDGDLDTEDVALYEDAVEKAEVRVAMAEIDVDAWQRKTDVNEERMPAHTEGVTEARAASWHRIQGRDGR